MSLKILLVGDNEAYLHADKLYLRDRGLHVHTCEHAGIISELIDEIKPDVIFIDPHAPTESTTGIFHSFLDNRQYMHIPVIYTLAEDDVYLVNRKRTAKGKRNIIADNMIDAIKIALTNPTERNVALPLHKKQHLPLHRHAYRA